MVLEFFHEMFLKIDFKLDDIFCDSSGLKESWDPGEDQIMKLQSFIVLWPNEVLTFSIATLFSIEMEKLHNMNENSDIDNSTDERTVDFEWAVHNQHNQLHCRFQIIRENVNSKTPYGFQPQLQ